MKSHDTIEEMERAEEDPTAPVAAPRDNNEEPAAQAKSSRTGFRAFTVVLIVFLIAQGAFVAYAHWFLTHGLERAVGDLSESSVLKDLRAITEASLHDLDGLDIAPNVPPSNEEGTLKKSPGLGGSPLELNTELSMEDLLDAVESLGHAFERELRALEDPAAPPSQTSPQDDATDSDDAHKVIHTPREHAAA